jgi:hypothetical protein
MEGRVMVMKLPAKRLTVKVTRLAGQELSLRR